MNTDLLDLAEQLALNLPDIDLKNNADMVFIERFETELNNLCLSPEISEFYASHILSDLSGLSIEDPSVDTAISSLAKTYATVVSDVDSFWRNKSVSSKNVKIRVVTVIKSMTISV